MEYALAVLAGMLAGVINTLAGSGSLITLPMLIFMGLDATVANGTNRVGVLLASLVGARGFRKGGHLDTKGIWWLLGPAIAGSAVGALIAARIDPAVMHKAIGGVMVLMLGVILLKPKRWLVERADAARRGRGAATVAIFFAIGVYGGFVQAGVGIFLLAALVLHQGRTLVQANALKLILVLVFTVPALAIFVAHGQVNWGLGLLMATGQMTGAWLAATFATKHPNANVWIRRLLILVVAVSILRLFDVPGRLKDVYSRIAHDRGRVVLRGSAARPGPHVLSKRTAQFR